MLRRQKSYLTSLIFIVKVAITFCSTVVKEKCIPLEDLSKNSCSVVDPSVISDQSSVRTPCFCKNEICGNYSLDIVTKNCQSGYIHTNKCGACVRCAKDLNEACGGPADYLGICRQDLSCEIQSSSQSQGEGICVKSKSNDTEGNLYSNPKSTLKLSEIKDVCNYEGSKSLRSKNEEEVPIGERKGLENAWRKVMMDEPLPKNNPFSEPVQADNNDLELGKMIQEFKNLDDARDFLKKNGYKFEEVSGTIKDEIESLQRGNAVTNPLEVLAQQGVSPETVDGIVAAGNVNQFPTFSNRPKVFKNRMRVRSNANRLDFAEAEGSVNPKNSLLLGKVIQTFKTEEEAKKAIEDQQLKDVEMVSGDAVSSDIQRGVAVDQPYKTLSSLQGQPQIVNGAVIAGPRSKFSLLFKP